jgi:cytochrome c biogenesis protein CcdA/glutaredoxin
MDNKLKIVAGLVIVVLAAGAIFFVISQQPTQNLSSSNLTSRNATIVVFYFYGDGCSHCEKVKPVLVDLRVKYSDLDILELEVYNNAENRLLLTEMSRKFGVANPGVPALFIGNSTLIGDDEITERFESEILFERERLASCNITAQPVTPSKDPTCTQESPQLSLLLVIFAAMVDSINPCGLSVLVFLLIPMAAAGSRRRILLVGGTYITAMFLFHLLVGIGLFSVFSLSGFSRTFALIGGVVALLLGSITITDVLRNKETFILSIPESQKGMLGTYIHIASLPAAFVLGILAGILGFSCTGGIYISILGLMGREMTVMSGLPWLALYNLVYILPLILITLLIAYGISPERADRMRTEYKRALRMVIGVILVVLGAVILLGWLG